MIRTRILALVLAVTTVGVVAESAIAPAANAAVAPQLTRYPYLTDVVQTFATVNWATDRSGTKATLKFGRVDAGSCDTNTVSPSTTVSASKTGISVNGVNEYQWKAKLSNLAPNTQYCYRIFLGATDLLGTVASPRFWSQIPAGSSTPYSFAVFGDWGETDANGDNPQQTAILSGLGNSGARFALGTGDTGYDSGTQANYGDLQQKGPRISSIFGPNYWPLAGSTLPLFNAVGNHGMNATFFNNWPQDRVVANSGGKYGMETYCCENGATSQKAPSAWYAFDAGNARFYVLTTTWGSTNIGTSDEYGMDYAYRWQKSSPEYQWLKNDLQSHPSQLKFAVFHYPLYADNATEGGDPFLRGVDSLEGLLAANGVDMVFNGHAHMYERNFPTFNGQPTSGGLVSYVSGGGGARPQPISHCDDAVDAYGIGWSFTANSGSRCGSAVKPTQVEQVYHYLKVDVNGTSVTVTPYNALGQPFDAQTYNFAPDTTKPTAPSNLVASAPTGTRVDLTWGASSDANGIQAYDIYRDAGTTPIASVNGTTTSYSDTTVSENTPYTYYVTARDPAGNTSDPSNVAPITTPSADAVDPQPPSNVQATAASATRVDLTWAAGSDNVGVTNYDIYRGGTLVGSVGNVLAYSDTTVSASTSYSYTVRARDAAGNQSIDSSPPALVTTPSTTFVFADDFESGTLAAWTTVSGLTTSQGISGSGGSWVARETSTSAGATYAYKSISPTVTELYAKFRFQVLSRSTSVDLMRFRNATGGSKLSVYVSDTSGTLSTRNSAGTSTRSSGPTIVPGQWYTVEVHAKIASPTVTEVWLDGVHLTGLDATGDIGSTNIGQFLIGTTASGTYDVVFDDVALSKSFI